MFILARRIAGAIMLLGFASIFLLIIIGPSGHDMPDRMMSGFSSLTVMRGLIGLVSFLAWTLVLLVSGWMFIHGKADSAFAGIVGLLGFVFFSTAVFGSVYYLFDQVHGFKSFWIAYLFNIVPIAQIIAVFPLGRHHNLTPTPQQI